MTEYWKSQARKYCEFCKCWLADNKISISFHENGKRHKESVQKHISKLTKKSAKDLKKKEKIEDDIKKMEKAAMAAYMQDIQNNSDLTSQSINVMLGKTPTIVSPSIPETKSKEPPIWHEIKNNEGNSYYWNTQTNETTWDAPDYYLSLTQQEEQKLKELEKQKAKDRLKIEKQKEAINEVKAYMAREKMKERAVKKEKDQPSNQMDYGPSFRAPEPLGKWKPVPTKIEEKVDLELPKCEKFQFVPPVQLEPEQIKFKEKKVESLGEGLVDFKKRKLNSKFKRNIRQKNDED